ncbi:MAG: hypothetical protein HGA77_05590 [Chlorobiaceae bacterium]|nr:hypothetical protein [Chlorobiaceae bacterium]
MISIARQTYSRAYSRDAEGLVVALSVFADLRFVGLDPDMDSKSGKHVSLVQDASEIYNSDIYIGPEGGLLWLVAGLGKQCVDFTEHIFEIAKRRKRKISYRTRKQTAFSSKFTY